MIITIVIKLFRMKRNPRDIRGEMSKRARENDTGRKGDGWAAGKGGIGGSRRVQAVGGVSGLEGDASGAARLKPWQGGVP